MSNVNLYRAVLDVGSSRMVGCLGYEENGQWHIVAMAQRPIHTEVRCGQIRKVEEVGKIAKQVIDDLERATDCRICKVYVGANASPMYTKSLTYSKSYEAPIRIDENHLSSLFDEAIATFSLDNKAQEGYFVQSYKLDNHFCLQALGEQATTIEASYSVVLANKEMSQHLEESMELASLNDSRIQLGILASAQAVLTEEDKRKGVVVIDFGAETTGMCLYQDGIVCYMVVLPFGGNHLTKDLMQLGLNLEEAEELKCKEGTALHYTELQRQNKHRKWSELEKKANDIMVARIEEIVGNLTAQIDYSKVDKSQLYAGMVLTGGASRLPGLLELLKRQTGLEVRLSDFSHALDADSTNQYNRPEYAQLMGLLCMAKEPCCEAVTLSEPEQTKLFQQEELKPEPELEPKPKPRSTPPTKPTQGPKGKGFIDIIKEKGQLLFSELDNLG